MKHRPFEKLLLAIYKRFCLSGEDYISYRELIASVKDDKELSEYYGSIGSGDKRWSELPEKLRNDLVALEPCVDWFVHDKGLRLTSTGIYKAKELMQGLDKKRS